MEIVALVGSTLVGSALSAVWASIASGAFLLLISLIPAYVAAYRGCIKRSIGLAWVVVIADLGLLAMPPIGIAIWFGAFAYAFFPKRQKVSPMRKAHALDVIPKRRRLGAKAA